jgi:hypothetical protein
MLNRKPINIGDKSPSPPSRGKREGPVAQRREGEVGDAVIALVGPLTLPSVPGRRGERVKLGLSEPLSGGVLFKAGAGFGPPW